MNIYDRIGKMTAEPGRYDEKMYRILVTILSLVSALYTFAGNKMAVSDIDTVETFEAPVPDSMEICIGECDSKRLDSVPYLVGHARWREPWAYEALAECYRYGKGGVEKSMFNAMVCYEEAGKSVRHIAEESYESDPTDEFGLLNHLMDGLEKKRISEEDVIQIIDSPDTPKFNWAVFLGEILRQKPDQRMQSVCSRFTPDSDSDGFLVGLACLAMDDNYIFDKTFINVSGDHMQKIRLIGEKFPPVYDVIAKKMWGKYDEDTADKEKYLSVALECMFCADQAGFLSRSNMARLLTFCEENGIDERIPFSNDDLSRFDTICPRRYRDFINSPAVVEEEVVEVDECPVELIGE